MHRCCEIRTAEGEVVREIVHGHPQIGLGSVGPGLLDAHAARAHQGVVRKAGAHRKSGAVDDRVGIVVHAVDGAKTDRGHLLYRRGDHLDALPARDA